MRWKEMPLQGWGRAHTARVEAARPERLSELAHAVASAASRNGVAAFGAGRSYGDNALNDGGNTVLTERLDRILAFDPATGAIAVEPGVTFNRLLQTFLPRGWLVPVTPGTAFATLGGALAADVHGKNHETAGSFGRHVRWFDLLTPDGETRRVTPDDDPELFRATIGGMGLTGVILGLCLRLERVGSNAALVRERRIGDLDGFLAAFAERDQPYSVGWIDALARGRAQGRGILETARPAEATVPEPSPRRHKVPVDFPGFALNGVSVSAFNALYWRRVPAAGRERPVHWSRFLYPLDSILDWNRIYGKRGFRQFQCVVPFDGGEAALRRLLDEIAKSRAASFLAVLKAMGPGGEGMLSFPRAGYTLALDFPEKPGSRDLLARLERITRDSGGRIYLAKDSCQSPEGFAEAHPLDPFRAVLERVDPNRRVRSDQARRLGIRGNGP